MIAAYLIASIVSTVITLCVIAVCLSFRDKWMTPRTAIVLLIACWLWFLVFPFYVLTALIENEWWPFHD